MTDINKKVINIFKNSKNSENSEYKEEVKYFKGFTYVRLDKDINGKNFNEAQLLEYAEKCEYIVRIMRKKGDHIALYNYKVPHSQMIEFIEKFATTELNGKIIEIEKYIPETLA